MPVVKGGVWTNIEDEVLKAAVSKYGLNQWQRVSSLLVRKTAKQCKARWTEWLDPGIRKIEWSKEEDERLLHLAKLMPTQWRTIAPIVGRTATQCLERYQRLLDEAETRENDELGLGGPTGGETSAPTGDDVRKLRPGELDPDPESKPARPDAIDMDEDDKEMLSEARARLANTQGKKAKRKARERQLEESRRLATLQKRRELKAAGINTKIVNRKKGQMDYNADIPFEKRAVPGFYDTQEEQTTNEHQREAFDPRKQQLARKRQGDPEDNQDPKRQKKDEKGKPSAAFAAAAKAGQAQRIREAEMQSKRRALNLPAPQVNEGELEEIVKMGMAGERAIKAAGEDDDGVTKGLTSNYSHMVGNAPIRTPRAPAQEDHIANEIRNIRALTETQSSLLGGENTPLHEGAASTGFDGIAPRKQQMSTPNPMATPLRQSGVNGVGATPVGATPRDNFMINEAGERQLIPQTPRDLRFAQKSTKEQLRAKLSSLPRPKETEWELEALPLEQEETDGHVQLSEEDAAEADRRDQEARERAAVAEFKRQSQVYQKSLPRSVLVDYNAMLERAKQVSDPIEAMIAEEACALIAADGLLHPLPGSKIIGNFMPPKQPRDEDMATARALLEAEVDQASQATFVEEYCSMHESFMDSNKLPSYLTDTTTTTEYATEFSATKEDIVAAAQKGNKLESKLALHLGGYQGRAKTLGAKIIEASEALDKSRIELDTFRTLQITEEAAIPRRLASARADYEFVSKREREAQADFGRAREEMRELEESLSKVNGYH